MKILFISEYYPPKVMGGGEINLAQMAQELARQGHEIIVLTSSFPGLPKEEKITFAEKITLAAGLTANLKISQAAKSAAETNAFPIKILRRLHSGKKTSTLYSNFQRRFTFPKSIATEAKKIIAEEKPDIAHFIGTSIIAAPNLQRSQRHSQQDEQHSSQNKHPKLFATIESYPTLCPKGDRLYHGKKECHITCTWKQFLFCQQESSEIGKMKNRWYLKYNPLFLMLVYRYYQQLNKALSSCHLIAISGYVQKLLMQYQQQSVIVPNVFDTRSFHTNKSDSYNKNNSDNKTENHQTINSPAKKPVILYVGSLIKSKGPHILLEAIQGIDCRTQFYGEGILKEQLQEIIRKNDLDAQILPPVSYDLMPSIYAKADLIVFPSIWPEPFGRIPLEAMAAGKHIIASNIGAIPQIVGKNGYLVPPGNSQELRDAIIKVISTKKKKKVSLVQYEPSKVIARLLHTYEETT